MALILAIEPDRRQAARLTDLVRRRVRADLVLAETTEGALGAIGNRVPDLVLVPTLISPQDDAALAGALRVIAAAAHVNMLTIPVLADPAVAAPKSSGLLGRFRKQPKAVSTGCEPSVFAEQIKSYLADRAKEQADEEEDIEIEAIEDDEQVQPAVVEPPVAAPVFAEAAPPMESPPIVEAPAIVERPAIVGRSIFVDAPVFAIEREHEAPVTHEAPPQPVYAQSIEVEELQPVAEVVVPPVAEVMMPPVEEVVMAAAVEEPPVSIVEPTPVVEPIPVPVVETPVIKSQPAEIPFEEDPVVLAILSYKPQPLPEPIRKAPRVAPAPKVPVAAKAPEALAPQAPLAPEAPEAPALSQSELDKLYFAETGSQPPAPPAPRKKAQKPHKPEWSELVASLRVDVQRMRAEGTEPAKRGKSGVRPVAGAAAAPPRKTPKPIQDQWGLFDPEQCGFAALLAKLEEITEAPPSDGTSARVL